MTREEAIKQLRLLKGDITFGIASKVENKNQIEALSIAIASLETDEAYQLEYESTTKNCESCRYYGLTHEVCNYCYECSFWAKQEPTTKNDHHRQNIQSYAHDFGVSEEQAEKELRVTTKNDLEVDWDELKRKILMEVDGGTDDAWLAYGEVCDRISNSIDEFVADMR